MTTPPHPGESPEQEEGAATPDVAHGQPPPGYPGTYGYPGYPAYPVQRPTNGFAIASLVLGILIIVSWGITGILALIFGYIARRQIRERGEGGAGLAVAGIVLGWVGVGFLAILPIFGIIAFAFRGF
ncbi:MAG: DUF4190 domain-containing protein [Actinomycetota bacterium]|nr:DUF4190 domain-containing protein [Actinomycetota bacterium]